MYTYVRTYVAIAFKTAWRLTKHDKMLLVSHLALFEPELQGLNAAFVTYHANAVSR